MTTRKQTRRDFLKRSLGAAAAAAGAFGAAPQLGAAAATQKAPAVIKEKELYALGGSNFTKPTDEEMERQAATWAAKNHVKIKWERVSYADMTAKMSTAILTKAGPDLCQFEGFVTHLFGDSLADVSDVAEEVSKTMGGYFNVIEMNNKVRGVWRAVTFQFPPPLLVVREDYFKAAGAKVPTTWDEYIEAGKTLKKFGKPPGEAMSHSPSDPQSFWHCWLWAYGGKEVEADGTTVAIDSPETLEAVERAMVFFDEAQIPGVLAWDDNSNNRNYLASAISATHNSASITYVAQKDFPDVYNGSRFVPTLSGPKGRALYGQCQHYGIFAYSKNISMAKDLIRHWCEFDNLSKFLDLEDGYAWGAGPKLVNGPWLQRHAPKYDAFRDSLLLNIGRCPGWPGPPSRSAAEANQRFIVVDIFAKACAREMKPKEAITWGAEQLRAVYGRA